MPRNVSISPPGGRVSVGHSGTHRAYVHAHDPLMSRFGRTAWPRLYRTRRHNSLSAWWPVLGSGRYSKKWKVIA